MRSTVLVMLLALGAASAVQAQTPTTTTPTTATPTKPAPTTAVPSTTPGPVVTQPPSSGVTIAPPTGGPTSARRARPRMSVAEHFAAANTTKDGHLTLDQAKSDQWRYVVAHYSEIDTAKQGYITVDQLHGFMRARRSAARAARAKTPASTTQN